MKLPHWPVPHGKKQIDLGLTRIKEMLVRVGNPQLKLPPVIHVAGTNGKGSTIAYLKSILQVAGYKVHTYTSPHLVRFNERITLAGHEIEDGFLTRIIEECRIASSDLELTFFEGTTAAAFLAFSRVEGDILLLETGLGGRLDATNVIDKPLLSIITPISLDHTEYLCQSLALIANEKAGIIKPHSKCVISWQPQEVMAVLVKKCCELEVPYYAWNEHWQVQGASDHFLFTSQKQYRLPLPSLVGLHQIINAATAVAAINLLDDFKVAQQHIEYGLTHSFWPARLEKINKGKLFKMLPPGSELWLDGAHNVAGAAMLIASINNMPEKLPLYLINGRSKDRDIGSFLECFVGQVEFFCATHIKSEPLSEDANKIYEIANKMGFLASSSQSVKEAVEKCLQHVKGKNNSKKIRILICGSLYLAGDVLAINQGLI